MTEKTLDHHPSADDDRSLADDHKGKMGEGSGIVSPFSLSNVSLNTPKRPRSICGGPYMVKTWADSQDLAHSIKIAF